MPKAKLTFQKSDIKKLQVAASFSNVSLGESIAVGNEVIIETSYRDPQSLIRMMDLKHAVTGTELDAVKPEQHKPAKAANGK